MPDRFADALDLPVTVTTRPGRTVAGVTAAGPRRLHGVLHAVTPGGDLVLQRSTDQVALAAADVDHLELRLRTRRPD